MARTPLSAFAATQIGGVDAPGIVQLYLLATYINSGGNQAPFADGIDFEDSMDLSETNYTNCEVWTAKNYLKGSIVYRSLEEYVGGVFYCHMDTEDSEEPFEDVFGEGGNYWMMLYDVTGGIGAGHLPIGDITYPLTIPIFGNGITISNLYSYRPTTSRLGLFGMASANINRISIVNANITGNLRVGLLAGNLYGNNLDVSDCFVEGSVVATAEQAGGLFGIVEGLNTIRRCASAGSVVGVSRSGGFVGTTAITTTGNFPTITDCFSTASITTTDTGTTNGWATGGFVGRRNFGNFVNCWSSGLVTVAGANNKSGFIGFLNNTTGGGGDVTDCFWDIETSGCDNSEQTANGTYINSASGETTLTMQQLRSVAPWDFVNVWQQRAGLKHNDGYPSLLSCDGRLIKRRREPVGAF